MYPTVTSWNAFDKSLLSQIVCFYICTYIIFYVFILYLSMVAYCILSGSHGQCVQICSWIYRFCSWIVSDCPTPSHPSRQTTGNVLQQIKIRLWGEHKALLETCHKNQSHVSEWKTFNRHPDHLHKLNLPILRTIPANMAKTKDAQNVRHRQYQATVSRSMFSNNSEQIIWRKHRMTLTNWD